MPLLPVDRSANDTRGRKKLSGQMVSGGDAPVVNPGVARAKPLNVPEGAFDSGLSQVAQETAPFVADTASRLQAAEVKQQDREESISRAHIKNAFTKEATALTLLYESKKDGGLGLQANRDAYGAELAELQKSHLGQLGSHSDGSRAKGEEWLITEQGRHGGIAAQLGAVAGEAAKDAEFNGAVREPIDSVYKNGSSRSLADAITDISKAAVEADYVSDPMELEEKTRRANASAVKSSLSGSESRLDYDQMARILENPLYRQMLSPEEVDSYTAKINASKISGAKIRADYNTREDIHRERTGKGFSEAESKKALGVLIAPDKQSEKAIEIQALEERGYSTGFAEDMVNDRIKIVGPDEFKVYHTINKLTGEKRAMDAGDEEVYKKTLTDKPNNGGTAGAPAANTKQEVVATEVSAEQKTPPKEPNQVKGSLKEAALEGTGLISNIQTALVGTFGFLKEGQNFKITTDAKMRLNLFSQSVKKALANSDRFAKFDHETIIKLLPDTERSDIDPETTLANLELLHTFLVDKKKNKQLIIEKGGLTGKKRADLSDELAVIDEILLGLEGPADKVEPLPKDVPEGSVLKGEHEGVPMWQFPDGKTYFIPKEDEAKSSASIPSDDEVSKSLEAKNNKEINNKKLARDEDLERVKQAQAAFEESPDDKNKSDLIVAMDEFQRKHSQKKTGAFKKKITSKFEVTSSHVKNNEGGIGQSRHQPGQGEKGPGFIEGIRFDKDNKRMTEVTIGIKLDGKEVDVPLINGLTTKADMKVIASGKIDPVIDAKAELFALARIAEDKSIFLEKGEKQIPLEFKLTKLKPAKEKEFQAWIKKQPWHKEFKKDKGEFPNLDTKAFDYRGAWQDGETPTRSTVDNKLHWGSKFKATDHPTKWKDTFMTASGGIDPDDVGVKTVLQGLDWLKNQKNPRNQETPDGQDLERIVQLFDELESDPSDKNKEKQVVKLLAALEKKLGIKVDEAFIKNARK